MITKLWNIKVMITILNIIHFGSSTSAERKFMLPLKPANCFIPNHCQNCDYCHFPASNRELVAWYFNDFSKDCTPYYTDKNEKNFCTGLANRPRTRKECEDMCGEPCVITHNNFVTEHGVCQQYCYIDVPLGVEPPCKLLNGWYGPGCCPRGYQPPLFLLMEAEAVLYDQLHKVIASKEYTEKMILYQGNTSILNDDVTADWIVS